MPALVTLLTDFGTADGFVGAMKGVILSRAPDAVLVDITHEVRAQDIRAGARALRESARAFPPGTIHLAVVDPGVGTERRPLLMRAGARLFLGPDNGVLSLAAPRPSGVWVLDRSELLQQPVSPTFHGRDVFASVAGHLAAGRPFESCGSSTEQWVRLELNAAVRRGSEIRGEVVHVDHFGNLVTNIERQLVDPEEGWAVKLTGRELGPIRRTYGEVAAGEWLAYWGSGGELEIAVREGRADRDGTSLRAEVTLCKS